MHLGYLAGIDWTGLLIDVLRGDSPNLIAARPGVRNCTPLLDAMWIIDGLRPQHGWPKNLSWRIRKVLKPGWKLDSGHDFPGKSEWLCHMAIGWQGFSAIAASLLTGRTIGHCFVRNANYDPVKALPMRHSRSLPRSS